MMVTVTWIFSDSRQHFVVGYLCPCIYLYSSCNLVEDGSKGKFGAHADSHFPALFCSTCSHLHFRYHADHAELIYPVNIVSFYLFQCSLATRLRYLPTES